MRNRAKHYKMVRNAFCPTGVGGGVDPSCSPSSSVSSTVQSMKSVLGGEIEKARDRFAEKRVQSMQKTAASVGATLDEETVAKYREKYTKEYEDKLEGGMAYKIKLPGDRWVSTKVTSRTGADGDVKHAVRIDFGIEDRSATYSGKELEKESIAMLRKVKELVKSFQAKGIPVEVDASDERRKEMYGEWMKKQGFKAIPGKRNVITYNTRKSKKVKRASPLRFDPTRTTTLRRAFVARLRRGFARLRLAVVDLIDRQDALGLRDRRPMIVLGNAFCPTGPGGGQDNSCSPNGGGSIKDKSGKEYKVVYDGDRTFSIAVPGSEGMVERGVTAGAVTLKKDKSGVMSVGVHPEFRRKGLASALYDHIEKYLGYPLKENWATTPDGEALWKSRKNKPTTNERWRFSSDPDKLKQFQEWLKTQIKAFLVGMTEEELWRRYVEEGFKKGAGRAFQDVKPRVGWTPREAEFYAGSKDQFLRSAFGRPESVGKVKLLASRSFDEMKGMTEDMTLKMGRALVDGLTRGANPNEIARDLVKQIDVSRTRAETIARTEIIRAHAEGQLQAFEEMGVDEIGVMVEWTVTEDEALCPLCEAMAGVVLKIEEARGMIPRHPNCRCAFIPANVGEATDDQTRGKSKIVRAVKISARMGNDEFSTAVPVSKVRPTPPVPVTTNRLVRQFSSLLRSR